MELSPVNCPEVPPHFHKKLRTRFINKLKEVANDEHLDSSVSLYKGITTLSKNYDDIDYLVEQ
jgi:hypothetical protein